MRRLLDIFQAPAPTPIGNGANVHMQEVCGRPRGGATIPALPVGTDAWRLGAARGKGLGIAEPGHFRRCEGPPQAWGGAFVM
jgi:hypothetical protein